MFLRPLTASRRNLPLSAILTCLTLVLTGCGYHQAGSATHIPANVRTLAVPIFATNAQAFHTEMAFTEATIRELNTRTKYQILNSASPDADATLRGTILTQTVAPLTYDSNSGETSSYLVTITASAVLTARDGRVLYKNDNYVFRQQYQATTDLPTFLDESPAAVDRLSRDFAKALVSDVLESF